MTTKQTKQTSLKSKVAAEQVIKARAVSRGLAVGTVVCLIGKKRQFYRIALKENQVASELKRFRSAVKAARRQLSRLIAVKTGSGSETQSTIFDAHLMILEDAGLLQKIENEIENQKVNAEWAVKFVTDGYLAIYEDIKDEYLRERRIDLQDITERLLAALSGSERTRFRLKKDSVIVAAEVKPSTLVELSEGNVKAIITEAGGWTSHTFILARELGIPAVTGVKGALRRVKNGDIVLVDGNHGQIVVSPGEAAVAEVAAAETRSGVLRPEYSEKIKGPLKTLDGRAITIRTNLDIGEGYARAKRFGAEGVGLFRSEFLFNQNQGMPNERMQYEAYRKIGELAKGEVIRIRTFDLSLEQLNDETGPQEKNPALGLRAIRLSLSHEKMFRTQIRALLRASADAEIDIMLPMISDISEVSRSRTIIEEEREKLEKRNIRCGNPKLGVMIEVPSAVMMVEEIAQTVDFMSVGTNDLVQYLLGVDRDNEFVADWFRTLHPAVLRSLRKIVDASERFSVPTIICGEMAGSPVYAAILVGLGARELSMNVNSMLRVRHVISNIAFEEARAVVASLAQCKTAYEVESTVCEQIREKWSHLFSEEVLPPIDVRK